MRNEAQSATANKRILWWYAALLFVLAIIIGRLFYLQIIKHDYYHQLALSDQLKEYNIAPERGGIYVHDASGTVPLVLNQKLYTLYGDPALVKNIDNTGFKLASLTGGDAAQYRSLLKTPHSRYVILAKRLNADQKRRIEDTKLPGIGLQAQDYRVYPQGSLAAQVLGFVNNEGQGNYGQE
jgi:cell division protein FtsI/penicillin-binding protein 2